MKSSGLLRRVVLVTAFGSAATAVVPRAVVAQNPTPGCVSDPPEFIYRVTLRADAQNGPIFPQETLVSANLTWVRTGPGSNPTCDPDPGSRAQLGGQASGFQIVSNHEADLKWRPTWLNYARVHTTVGLGVYLKGPRRTVQVEHREEGKFTPLPAGGLVAEQSWQKNSCDINRFNWWCFNDSITSQSTAFNGFGCCTSPETFCRKFEGKCATHQHFREPGVDPYLFPELAGGTVYYLLGTDWSEADASDFGYEIDGLCNAVRGGKTEGRTTLRFTILVGSSPIVEVAGPCQATVGQAVQFSAIVSDPDGGGFCYNWTILGTSSLSGWDSPIATAVWDSPGAYVVSVEVTDPQGHSAQGKHTVQVLPPPSVETP